MAEKVFSTMLDLCKIKLIPLRWYPKGVVEMREWVKYLVTKYLEEPFCQVELMRAEMLKNDQAKPKLRLIRGHKKSYARNLPDESHSLPING